MANRPTSNKELRTEAEARARKISPSPEDVSLEKTKTLLHELEVHQVELEMQNEELREAQHRLEEARDQYSDLFDFAPIGYLLLNEKGVITNINLSGSDLLGLERLHIKGKPFSSFMSIRDSSTLFLKLKQAFENGILPSIEIQLKRGTHLFTALLKGIVSEDKKLGIPICRISMQDVTELRKTEALKQEHSDLKKEQVLIKKYNEELEGLVKERTRELSDALETEKEINEIKSDFITIASHELRTPITIIMSSIILIDKLRYLGQDEKVSRQIERVKSSVKHFTSILEDFLSLENLERGAVRVRKEKFDIPEFSAAVIQEIEGMLENGRQVIYSHKGDEIFTGDKKILRSIVLNLLSNAIKYSEADIEVETMVHDEKMTFSVTDSGIGIPEEDEKKLFTRFYRAKNAADYQGTGLGLSIVKHYLELVGGSIGFTSKLNEGSTFTIEIKNVN